MERKNPLENQHEHEEHEDEEHEEQQPPQKREAALKSQQATASREEKTAQQIRDGLGPARTRSAEEILGEMEEEHEESESEYEDDEESEYEDDEESGSGSGSGSEGEDLSNSPRKTRETNREERELNNWLTKMHRDSKKKERQEESTQKMLDTKEANRAEEIERKQAKAEHKEALRVTIMAEMGKYPTHPHIRAAFVKYAKNGDARGFYSLKGLIETRGARIVEEHRRRLTEERQQRKAEEKRQQREADEEAFKAAEAAEAENRFGSGRQCAAADNSLRRRTVQVLGSSSRGVPGSSRAVPGSSRAVPGSSRAVPGSSRAMGAPSRGGLKWNAGALELARQSSLTNAIERYREEDSQKEAENQAFADRAMAEAAAKAAAEAASEAAPARPLKRPSKSAKAGGRHRR